MLDNRLDSPSPATVLVADADEGLTDLARQRLEMRGMTVTTAVDGDHTLLVLDDDSPDVILLDPSLATSDGERVLDLLTADKDAHQPVIVLTTDDPEVIERALVAGAHDHLPRQFHNATLAARIESAVTLKRLRDEVTRQRETLARLARVDTLTGLMNRAQMEAQLVRAAATAQRHGRVLSLILMDVDGFTKINHHAGNEAGDMVLQDLARHVMADIRTGDAAARWDGDQFMLLLPETPAKGARVLAERLRETISDFGAQLPDGTTMPLTVSFGCAEGENATEMVRCASQRLAEAQQSGGNAVRV